MHFLLIIFVFFFIYNLTDKTLSVNNLCEQNGKIRPNFDEIFGQKWDNEKMEENETDQKTNCLQSDQNGLTGQNDQFDQQRREIVHKFHAIREGIIKKRKYSAKIWNKIEQKIAKKLGISRKKIYKLKKEFNLKKAKINEKIYYEKKKREFIERINEFKRSNENGKQKQLVKELGISKMTFRKWKKEFGIEIGNKYANRYSNEEKMCKMNDYYKMKNNANPSLTDKEIAGLLKISVSTLKIWKKETKS